MENRKENEQKFRALYLGQDVYLEDFNKCMTTLNLAPMNLWSSDESRDTLLLKPLSSITDEDAIEVWDLLHRDGANKKYLDKREIVEQGKNISKSLQHSNTGWMVGLLCVIECYQYLQSKGYALPYMGLSVETMVEYGWIRLKELE